MLVRLIGDTHCKREYLNSEYFQHNDIQIGDCCLIPYDKWAKYDKPRFMIAGNHDFFPQLNMEATKPYEIEVSTGGKLVKTNLFHIPNGYYSNGVLFIGGANSIDKHLRTEGIDWFREESLTYKQMDNIMNIEEHIHTVISHECPMDLWKHFFPYQPHEFNTVARDLDLVLKKFKPRRWVFGHHHSSFTQKIDDCLYTCLNEGEKLEILLDLDFLD